MGTHERDRGGIGRDRVSVAGVRAGVGSRVRAAAACGPRRRAPSAYELRATRIRKKQNSTAQRAMRSGRPPMRSTGRRTGRRRSTSTSLGAATGRPVICTVRRARGALSGTGAAAAIGSAAGEAGAAVSAGTCGAAGSRLARATSRRSPRAGSRCSGRAGSRRSERAESRRSERADSRRSERAESRGVGTCRCVTARGATRAAIDAAGIAAVGARGVVVVRAGGGASVSPAGVATLHAGPVLADLGAPAARAGAIGVDRDVVGVSRSLEAAARNLAGEIITVAIVGGPNEAGAALTIDGGVRRVAVGAPALDRFAHVLYLDPPRGGFALRHPLRPLSVAYGVS